MELQTTHHISLAIYTTLLLVLIKDTKADEYGSYHDSHPPFHYIRSRFSCVTQNRKILWDSMLVEVHPGRSAGCGVGIRQTQDPDLWSSIDRCLNDDNSTSVAECQNDEEYGTVFQVNKTKLLTNSNVTFPCIHGSEIPEIIAIHLIYTCKNNPTSRIHPDDDIMTMSPLLPPIPQNSGSSTPSSPAAPPKPNPTMVVDPTEHQTSGSGHVIVTEATTSTKPAITTKTDESEIEGSEAKSEESANQENTVSTKGERAKESSSHPITYYELAVIVGPSVAAVSLLILILVAVVVLVKRKNLKLPVDLQGESLFHSRRFSTASQLSDISVNGQQMRAVP